MCTALYILLYHANTFNQVKKNCIRQVITKTILSLKSTYLSLFRNISDFDHVSYIRW